MAVISGPPTGATRNMPISDELRRILSRSAEEAGVDEVRIVSGGQPAKGEGTRRTGSTRHDHGRAADLRLIVGGSTKAFSDNDADPVFLHFVTACAANGLTGIGAGVDYMGKQTIHVGFGTSPADKTRLTWGAGGRSANAPQWLRDAAKAGWDSRDEQPGKTIGTGQYAVMAREGLKVRQGPGPEFEASRTLSVGTILTVLGVEGGNGAWARVDLEGDGLSDGHVFAAYLAPFDAFAGDQPDTEPQAA